MENVESKAHLKKMRLQLFDGGLNQLEDRLVSQDTELRKGPAEVHKGPIKLEVCLFEKEDIDRVVLYINQLVGYLPVELTPKKARKEVGEYTDDKSWRETLLAEIIQLESQDEMVARLRKEGFIFMTSEHLADLGLIEWAKEQDHLTHFQWMIKLLKEAKSPVNNKYDPKLLIGFKLLGEKTEEVYSLLHGSPEMYHKVWKKANKVTFKKSEMAKFPVWMNAEEREKFRTELYKARKATDEAPHEFSKFFKRWYQDVDFREKEDWAQAITNS